eukprot:1976823-Amphidinium_carterae.1
MADVAVPLVSLMQDSSIVSDVHVLHHFECQEGGAKQQSRNASKSASTTDSTLPRALVSSMLGESYVTLPLAATSAPKISPRRDLTNELSALNSFHPLR